MKVTMQNCMTEFSLRSGKAYDDPFNDVEVDAVFTGPDGRQWRVPAFWAGENTWRIRFSSPLLGRHTYRTECSDTSNMDLHEREGVVRVIPYEGSNPLLKHGPLCVSENKRYLQHADGTPFFWLADTWWLGLCKRLRWPEDFQLLVTDRRQKGFTVIQIVAGLYPDMPPFDERGANEAGFPWERDYSVVNPDYFDMADLRIGWLVDRGLLPCILGSWGYWIEFMGAEAMKKHWRYLIARWGAYPVVWCIAGEVLMPWYLKEFEGDQDRADYENKTKAAWSDVTDYIRRTDPYHRPVTAHPCYNNGSRLMVKEELLDFEMLQTGHSGFLSIPNTVRLITESVQAEPHMPVINGEVCYEGIGESSRQEIQRFMFWTCLLSGAAGHTYGANGTWQFNTRENPYGPSPHGMSWGDTPWEDAYRLPGSRQVGIGKKLLERYEWWRIEPDPESVEPHWSPADYIQPCAARIPGQCRIIFLPTRTAPLIKGLEPYINYKAFYFNPVNGTEYAAGEVQPDASGNWKAPGGPIFQDWVLIIEENVQR